MPGFRIYNSNRLEELASGFCRKIFSKPPDDPLALHTVIVQSYGMEKWLSLEIAKNTGICANIRFLFPNLFIEELVTFFCGDAFEKTKLTLSHMKWRIAKILPELARQDARFKELRNYFEEDEKTDPLRLMQLSAHIADLFDQYAIFRRDMALKWDKGEDKDKWQAVLWRHLFENYTHRARLPDIFKDKISGYNSYPGGIASVVNIFGISHLPQFHLDFLSLLSGIADINLFFINPCREYWYEDIVTENTRIKHEDTGHDLHFDTGNPLLASMGGLAADFLKQINENISHAEEYSEFIEPEETTILNTIQKDILNLAKPDDLNSAGASPRQRDFSVNIYSCHSPLREIETLKDYILECFNSICGLKPEQIAVMAPDIETYAPYINMVFGNDRQSIPFSISDRSYCSTDITIKTFFQFLLLPNSRWAASDLISLMETPFICKRFNIHPEEIPLIKKWIIDANIRWGFDETHKKQLGLPPFAENTWSSGFNRLFMGYAIAGNEQNLFEGILPCSIEGKNAVTLGNFYELVETLQYHAIIMEKCRPAAEWSAILLDAFENCFITEEENFYSSIKLKKAIASISDEAVTNGFSGDIDIRTVRWLLSQTIKSEISGHGFLSKGITFCSLLPMRGIPFRVICLIGMDFDNFPRKDYNIEFDMISSAPRAGDRSRSKDDRYLFLEAIFSARDSLLITYTGRDIKDNAEKPPSVLVSELKDYIRQRFSIEDITIEHKFQPFSSVYFETNSRGLFSYSEENLHIAEAMQKESLTDTSLFSKKITAEKEDIRSLELTELISFFKNPAKYFLKKILGVHLENTYSLIENDEPFELSALDKYLIGENILKKEDNRLNSILKAEGRLPHGNLGIFEFNNIANDMKLLQKHMEKWLKPGNSALIRKEISCNRVNILCSFKDLYGDVQVFYRPGRLSANFLLHCWLYHLLLNCAKISGCETIIGTLSSKETEICRLLPVTDPESILQELLDIYSDGLCRPLHFFPESSKALTEKNKKDEAYDIKKAETEWYGNDYTSGESKDLYYKYCFRSTSPLDEEFIKLSTIVFKPVFEHKSAAADETD